MANGILGKANLTAATNTTLATITALKTATFSVNFCNRGSVASRIRLAMAATATPDNTEWVEYDTIIDAGTTLERTGLALEAGKLIVVYADTANVTAMAYGFEE